MEHIKLLLTILIPSLVITLTIITLIYLHHQQKNPKNPTPKNDLELGNNTNTNTPLEKLLCFQGGENLVTNDILDAPGEVIGKSSYGTLYKASIILRLSEDNDNGGTCEPYSDTEGVGVENVVNMLLRFIRPLCSGPTSEVISLVNIVGLVRNVNLVPLVAFYVGPRGEMLLVFPFFYHGNLALFLKDANSESRKWDVIYGIVLGIVRGLAYLHSGLSKPMIHGNLKSKNILLGPDFQPCISDYGLHLLLNQTAGQEMLETSAAQGYKAPELMKIKDSCESTDIYSLGIVLLELLTGREPIDEKSSDSQEVYLPNVIRKAILDHRIKDMYHRDIVLNLTGKQRHRIEDRALKLVQLAMSCCSPSPSLRPLANEVVRKVEELSKDQPLQRRT